MKCTVLLVTFCLLMAGTFVFAAAPQSDNTKQILQWVQSHDPQQVAQAIKEIGRQLGDPDPAVRNKACWGLTNNWLKPLMKAKQYAAVAELTLAAECADASNLGRLEFMQINRVTALLALDKPKEALPAAKGLYNIAGMGTMQRALLLIAKAVRAANPNDLSVYTHFINEQTDGAGPSTQPAAETVLAGVKIDPKPYEAAIEREEGDDYNSLTQRGNLLLLADDPEKAKIAFQAAYDVAADWQLADATESLARVMKAQDHTVGRANAFVLSLRPKMEAKP